MAHIILEENKLLLTKEAVQLLNATPGSRIALNYVQVSNEHTFPVIAKAEFFADPEAGNKLTKSNTISFRGLQNNILKMYGVEYNLEKYKEGIYKMVSINNN